MIKNIIILSLIFILVILYINYNIDTFNDNTFNDNTFNDNTINNKDNITVISGFWNVKNKYNGFETYKKWFNNSLKINQRYIFFTNKSNNDIIKEYRNNYETEFIDYDIHDFYSKNYLPSTFVTHNIHVPSLELALIWNEKMHLVKLAKDYDLVNNNLTEFYIWIDAGVAPYRNITPPDIRLNLLNINSLPHNKLSYAEVDDTITGSVLIFHRDIIDTLHDIYYNTLATCNDSFSCGSDQYIFTTILKKYPSYFYRMSFGYGENLIKLYNIIKTTYLYTAIIIEPRQHKALEYVLTNFTDNLDNNWSFIIYHGNNNKDYINNIINTKLLDNQYRIKLINLNVDNLSINDYNSLLLNKDFYNTIPTEIFLIFQTDTIICSKFKDTIYKFIDYDYVGAPWIFNNSVGNGGLSLRKKSKMLEILDNCSDRKHWDNEDKFFSEICTDKVNINKPLFEDAKEFSIETVYSDKSFGIHKSWNYLNNEQINNINNYCPELNKLIELNT